MVAAVWIWTRETTHLAQAPSKHKSPAPGMLEGLKSFPPPDGLPFAGGPSEGWLRKMKDCKKSGAGGRGKDGMKEVAYIMQLGLKERRQCQEQRQTITFINHFSKFACSSTLFLQYWLSYDRTEYSKTGKTTHLRTRSSNCLQLVGRAAFSLVPSDFLGGWLPH